MQFFKYVYADNMAGRAAKQLLRRELKARLLALSNSEKIRQSKIVTEQVCVTISRYCLHAIDNLYRIH